MFVDLGDKSFAIVGGGLVGCLLGVYLRKRGFEVAFFESRFDPRSAMEVRHWLQLTATACHCHNV